MEICRYCLVCTKPCLDECKDYIPNKGFEYLELKWEIEDSNPNKFNDEPSAKEKMLSMFTNEELESELKRRKYESQI